MKMKSRWRPAQEIRLRRIIIQSNTKKKHFHLRTSFLYRLNGSENWRVFKIKIFFSRWKFLEHWRARSMLMKWKEMSRNFPRSKKEKKPHHKSNCEAIEWFIVKLEFLIILLSARWAAANTKKKFMNYFSIFLSSFHLHELFSSPVSISILTLHQFSLVVLECICMQAAQWVHI